MVDRTGLGERFASEMSLEEPEVPLYETSKERQQYDEMANLYAIIMATEHLERAFVQDAIDQKTYTYECKRLISQFGVAEHVLRDQMSTETFMNVYQMDCPRAVERLLVQGVPQAMKGGDSNVNHAATVAETVQYFITTMDAVRLEQRYVDELQPLLSDLMDSLTRLPETPNDFEPNRVVQSWLQKLNAMRAVDEIEEGDARQLLHDLDSAYTEFTRFLKSQSSS
mmetsp:Transcript_27556/g.57654  ORF Transcript_27556/g.57654 Transcript_27556/m.57654 type:complete len:225 (-) Transcript_27556:61-735(-)